MTILLVEDNEDDVFLMQFALKTAGIYNPLQVVEDGERAVDYLRGSGEYADRARFPYPAVIFLDVKLPYMSGFDVLEWIKSRPDLASTPVVVLSSSNSPRDIELAAKFGVPYAIKPPDTDLFQRVAAQYNLSWLPESMARNQSVG
jgi:CheY-like chemotaxis protein